MKEKDQLHLIIDGKRADNGKLGDRQLIYTVLNELPRKIGMKTLTIPRIIEVKEKNKKKNGLTGDIIINTSHIAIHTWSNLGKLMFDLFSCKTFDNDKVVNYIKEKFDVKEMDVQKIKRMNPLKDG